MPAEARLLAVSDLHVAYPQNRQLVGELRPRSAEDWLLVAGDVGERLPDIEWALRTLSERFARVVWVPGNHDLWTHRTDPVQLRGEERYRRLVEFCQGLGVLTPEDPYPVWDGPGGPVRIVPLFLLYDYSFRPDGARTKAEGLARAYDTGVVCTDERWLHPDPYPSVGGVVLGPGRGDPGAAGRPAARPARGPGQPLPADQGADPGTALPGVRAVVRHHPHRRLARPVQRGGRGLRPSAHPADDLAGRGAVRGGVAGLPAGVGTPGRPARPAPPGPARGSASSHGAARGPQ